MRRFLMAVALVAATLDLTPRAQAGSAAERRPWVATWGTAQLSFRAPPAPPPTTPAPGRQGPIRGGGIRFRRRFPG